MPQRVRRAFAYAARKGVMLYAGGRVTVYDGVVDVCQGARIMGRIKLQRRR